MHILLLGAGGFIARHIMAEMLNHGHRVTALVRSIGGLADAFPNADFLSMDLSKATSIDDWASKLAGIDVVVNAAGVLRGPDMDSIHVTMPAALCTAAQQAGVRRIILISAISARPDVATDYARSKLAGEHVLRASATGWTILRPSLVYGDGSYGGTSLLRGMAGLPWVVPLPGQGEFALSPIHVQDLAATVRVVCENDSYCQQTLEPVGPETMTLRILLERYRAWLGFGTARFVSTPMLVMRVLARIGDVMGDGPVSTNSLVQLIAGNEGDSAGFEKAIGFAPRGLDAALLARPAQVQDRWHARLFFLAPALKMALVLMWLASALVGYLFGAPQTFELVHNLALPAWLAEPLRIGSCLLDLGIAALLMLDRTARWSTWAQVIVVLGYTLAIGIALPALWLDPLGPLLKNIPILIAILVHGAVGDRR